MLLSSLSSAVDPVRIDVVKIAVVPIDVAAVRVVGSTIILLGSSINGDGDDDNIFARTVLQRALATSRIGDPYFDCQLYQP